jgi:hypothetical protein
LAIGSQKVERLQATNGSSLQRAPLRFVPAFSETKNDRQTNQRKMDLKLHHQTQETCKDEIQAVQTIKHSELTSGSLGK